MEIIISISSLVVALCALGFTAWQFKVQRRHNRITVKPHLFMFNERNKLNNTVQLQVILINNGLGPAYINKFQVFYKGQPCEPEAAISSALGELVKNSSNTILGDDAALSSNQKMTILSVTFLAHSEDEINKVSEKLETLDLLIEYSSAYEKMPSLDSRNNNKQKALS